MESLTWTLQFFFRNFNFEPGLILTWKPSLVTLEHTSLVLHIAFCRTGKTQYAKNIYINLYTACVLANEVCSGRLERERERWVSKSWCCAVGVVRGRKWICYNKVGEGFKWRNLITPKKPEGLPQMSNQTINNRIHYLIPFEVLEFEQPNMLLKIKVSRRIPFSDSSRDTTPRFSWKEIMYM